MASLGERGAVDISGGSVSSVVSEAVVGTERVGDNEQAGSSSDRSNVESEGWEEPSVRSRGSIGSPESVRDGGFKKQSAYSVGSPMFLRRVRRRRGYVRKVELV